MVKALKPIRIPLALLLLLFSLCVQANEPRVLTVYEPLSSLSHELRLMPWPVHQQDPMAEAIFRWLSESMRAAMFNEQRGMYYNTAQWQAMADSYTYDEIRRPFSERAESMQVLDEQFAQALMEQGLAEQVRQQGLLELLFLQEYADESKIPAHYEVLFELLKDMTAGHPPDVAEGCIDEFDCALRLYFSPGTLQLERMELVRMDD